jgi:S-DNA-T family DNA segregation ATPase FtsK/SpoIIIE
MRIDLTIRCRDGTEHDVAITVGEGARLGELAGALSAAVPGAEPTWNGPRRLTSDTPLGSRELSTGALLSAVPDGTGEDSAGQRLEIVGGANAGRGIPLRGGAVSVGRAPTCELTIDDPLVSRRHAVFTLGRSGVTVRDAGSTHGTQVDGRPVGGECTVPDGGIVRIGETFVAVSFAVEPVAAVQPGPDGTVLVNRRPDTAPVLHERVIDVPDPPDAAPAQRMHWAVMAAPVLAGVALAATMHSLQLLAFAALGPLALALSGVGERLGGRRRNRRSRAAHRKTTQLLEHEITIALRAETVARRAAQPDPAAVLRIGQAPGVRLWHRSRGDPHLLHLRFGLADLPSALRVNRGGSVAPAGTVDAVPAVVDLGRAPVGLVGPRLVRDALARWLVGQLAVLCSPADVEVALLISVGAVWGWTRWLPHLRGRIACTEQEHDAVVTELIDLSRMRDAARAQQPPWRGPWLVVIIDGPAAIAARLSPVLNNGTRVGITALCVADRASELPGGCTQVIRAAGETGATVRLDDLHVVADRVSACWADELARALAPLRDAEADPAAALPSTCRLAQLLGDDPATPASVLDRWRHCDGSAQAVLGFGADGRFAVNLDRDGPHMLIGGTTGSGKSELLQSLVVGLAAQHPPRELTFLLIDYKGGSAFAECASLPHVVGVVTDLDDHLVRRVLASLDSEIRRRERLLASVAARDRAELRAAGGSMPRLVIVVDEFAALIHELSGFVPGLVGIAQRGRSLGLHLVLATQRPAGVVSPEIRANVAIRVALRMTSAADSVDVIDTAEAATIDRRTPGRAYVRLGTDIHAVQCARVAGRAPAGGNGVVVLDAWRRLAPESADANTDTDLRRFVRAIVTAAAGEPAPQRPWLAPLPALISPADLPSTTRLDIPIGLVDLPREQRQPALTLDLARGGAVLVAGSPRSGRSSALLAMALIAAQRCSPDELELDAIDSTASALGALSRLPHLGTLANLTEGCDLAAALLARLEVELARRRDSLAAGNAEAALLVLVDGWEALGAAAEHYDGGRTIERLLTAMRDAPAARATVVVAGGRAALSARIAATAGTRFVLHQHDPGDYAHAGIDPRTVAPILPPGRAIRVGDGTEVQFAFPGSGTDQRRSAAACAARWPGAPPRRLRLRRLPQLVRVPDLPATEAWLLGVGGDEAAPVTLDLTRGTGRILVAGGPRSGRSTVLCSILAQTKVHPTFVAATARSPLAAAARHRNISVLGPASERVELPACGLLLVDDCEAFTDTEIGDELTAWVRSDDPSRIAVVAGRADAMAVGFRGLATQTRHSRCGILLQPGPLDGELLGVSLPRNRAASRPGRGVLVPDPAWQLGEAPIPIQVAMP